MLLTCPAVKSELEGNPPACQSLPVKPARSHPVCLPGEVQPACEKDMNCRSAEAKLEGNLINWPSAEAEGSHQAEEKGDSPALGLLPDVPVVFRAPQLQQSTQASFAEPGVSFGHPDQGNLLDGGSSQLEAESRSDRYQAGVLLLPRQCPAGLVQGSDATKRRCMPNWGRPSQAHTAPDSHTDFAGCHTNMAPQASTPAVLNTGAHHTVQDVFGNSQQDTQDHHTLGCVNIEQQQPDVKLMQWHSHRLSANAVRPLQLPTRGCGSSCLVQQPNSAVPDCRSAHGHGLLGIASQICRRKDRVLPSALL